MQALLSTTRFRLWFSIVVAVWLAAASLAASAADVDRPSLLRDLGETSSTKLATRASELAAKNSEDIRLLTLDLAFYSWANEECQSDPAISSLDQIVGALTSVGTDSTIGWVVANIGKREWTTKAPTASADNDKVKLLAKARQDFRAARDLEDRLPTRSIESLRSCAETLSSLDLDLSYAFVTTRMARKQFVDTHRYRDAERNFERAHPKFTAYGLRSQVAQIFDDLGRLQSEIGHRFDAYDSYKRSAQEWQAIGRGDLAGKELIAAGIARAASGQIDFAVSTMGSGLEIARGYAYNAKSYVGYTELLIEVADFCVERGMLAEARDRLVDAEKVAELANSPLLQGRALKKQADAWKALGLDPRYREAMTKREKLLSALIQEASTSVSRLSDTGLLVAEQTSLLSVVEKGAEACSGLDKHQQAIEMLRLAAERYDALGKNDDRTRVLRNLAVEYYALGSHEAALVARSDAARLARNSGKRAVVIEILNEIDEAATEAGDTGTALEALRELADLNTQAEDVLALAGVLEKRGSLLDSMGQTSEAIRDLDRAAKTYAAELGEPWSQARVLLRLASVQSIAEKGSDAASSLTTAINRIEIWAVEEGVDQSADPVHADITLNLYLQLVGIQISENKRADALDSLKRARQYPWFGRLRELLTASGSKNLADLIAELEKLPVSPRPPQLAGGVRRTAFGWPAVLSQSEQFSRFARTGRTLESVAEIDAAAIYAVREYLPDDLTILQYVLRDSSVFVFLARKNLASCWEIPVPGRKALEKVQEFQKTVADLEMKVASGIRIPPVKSWHDPALLPMMDPLYSLEDMLFNPIRGELSGIGIRTNTIAFVLPAELAGVPFHALPRDANGKTRFLIQDYVVSYLSQGTLSGLARQSPTPITAKTGRISVFSAPAGVLRGAQEESVRIQSLYKQNCRLYSGSSLTADRFVSAASWSNVVHVASHHQMDPNPAHFQLVLSGQSGGTVRMADLMRIRNPNLELAVISACEMIGTSNTIASAAPFAADMFALAGFPSIVGGMWRVSDEASRVLMESFYGRLSSFGQKGSALQRAAVSMIESNDGNFAHPFYWAGFALYGDAR